VLEPSTNIGTQKRKYSIVILARSSTKLSSIDCYLRNQLLPYILKKQAATNKYLISPVFSRLITEGESALVLGFPVIHVKDSIIVLLLVNMQVDTNNPIMLNFFPNIINSVIYFLFNRYA
jgi:hypothetical protein